MFSKFDYIRPESLAEALNYIEEGNGKTKILAGGTDLIVLLRRNLESPEHILDIKGIPETRRLEFNAGEIFIGASVTINEVAAAPVIQSKYPALSQAANMVASYQLRNRATLVGNICNASPGADLSGPLLVYDAKVHIAASAGNRVIPISDFFKGVKKTILQPNEIVIGISLPDTVPGDMGMYFKQTRVKGHDLGIIGLAIRLTSEKQFRVAMSAVAPTPIRIFKLEEVLNSEPLTENLAQTASEKVRELINPISDVRASKEYRRHIAGVLLKRALLQFLTIGGEQNVCD